MKSVIKYDFPNGDKYEGEVENNKLNGKGKYYFSEGGYIKGEFIDGFLNGQGERKFVDGSVYTGNFICNVEEGTGTIVYPDGEKYTGEFRNGKISNFLYSGALYYFSFGHKDYLLIISFLFLFIIYDLSEISFQRSTTYKAAIDIVLNE